MTTPKKLIEVALPLEAINSESLWRKQKAPKGWPTSFHKWWAQRPLSAARAVIFSQMVDDPSSHPDLFPTEKSQEKERLRLFRIIEDLVLWENTSNETVLRNARDEIWNSWRRTCAMNADHPQSSTLFNRWKLPPFLDPFAGSGSLPLSAQWLGLESYAGDLNPVAVLINKAMIEIPPMFAGKAPVNPETRANENLIAREWRGAQGLAEDVSHYIKWMRNEAVKRIGEFYPTLEVTAEMAKERPDLNPYIDKKLTVVAWIWARTVKSPDPAYANISVPLVSTFVLSSKSGKPAFINPIVNRDSYRFEVLMGTSKDPNYTKNGTKLSGANFKCIMSGSPISGEYIKAEGKAGRLGTRLMAIIAEGAKGRVFLSPDTSSETIANQAKPQWKPEVLISGTTQYLGGKTYGMDRFDQLFTNRQLVSLTTFSDLVIEAKERINSDAVIAGLANDNIPLREGGRGASSYADAISIYLACVVDRMAYYGSSFTTWLPKDNALRDCMPRQALAMTWDFAEGNPFAKSSGDIITCAKVVTNYLKIAEVGIFAHAVQKAAQTGIPGISGLVISTDPPYYDNVPYADLSDYFYIWLRHSIHTVFPDLFSTVAVPKAEELVAFAYRHIDGKIGAEAFFLNGMTQAMHRLAEQSHPAFPITIYYAFKQSESNTEEGTASTGWETFLDAVILAGFAISGTWPLRTEGAGRMRASDSNALASSIVLVCRKRAVDQPTATRREFLSALKGELPVALSHLQHGNIAPVDLAQSAIGPGMAIYTRYAKVIDASGNPLTVREALSLINQTLDEALAEQEGDFDSDSRWALAWFEQYGFADGEYGVAETLSKAKDTNVSGMVEAGILVSGKGKVRLLKPAELASDWDPATDARLSNWEAVHQLIRVLESEGEGAAAELARKLGAKAEPARELCYRLYTLCERKKRAQEALSYNALVQSWPEIMRLAQEGGKPKKQERDLFTAGEDEV